MSALRAQPCAACPYRRDVPSGVWVEAEYDKLPGYDAETPFQPPAAFFCHMADGKLCAGWVGCHDMQESLGLRLAVATGALSEADYESALDYVSPLPLWGSGTEAAEHGKAEVQEPSPAAQRAAQRLYERRQRRDRSDG